MVREDIIEYELGATPHLPYLSQPGHRKVAGHRPPAGHFDLGLI
ncbi:MAG TPA: hypothetical protein VFB58_16850 [Chloroflexota bacterium]|nr:hypothetical protein [Chloroflexota bacterium]